MGGNNNRRGSTALAVKVGLWYVMSTFMLKSIAFITVPIFSRLMNSGDYGEFSNYASWQSTLLILTGAELYNTLSRAYYDYQDDYNEYISSVTIVNCLLTAVVYMLFLINRSWIFNIVSIPKQYVHMLFFTLICTSCKTIYITRERTLYRYKSVALISALAIIIPTVISVILVYFANESDRLSARIYGFYVPSALIGLICAILLIIKGRAFKLEHCIYAFKLSLPLLVHYFTVYLLTSTNTIITKNVLGAEVTAVVSIATSVIHILTILFQSMSGAVTTWLMDNLEQHNYGKIKKETIVYLGILAVVSVGVVLFAPEVVWILGGKKYAGATAIIPGLVASIFIQSVSTLFTIILTYDKNVVKTAVYTGIVAILSIISKIMLLPAIGLQSLPLTNTIAYIVLFIINYLLVKQAGYGEVIDLKRYIALIILICAVSASGYVLYKNFVARYFAIFIFACIIASVLYKKRAVILSAVKKRKHGMGK